MDRYSDDDIETFIQLQIESEEKERKEFLIDILKKNRDIIFEILKELYPEIKIDFGERDFEI